MASGFGDMQSLLKQAQDMQRRMQETMRSLSVPVRNVDMELLFVRTEDIPELVADGVAELGTNGRHGHATGRGQGVSDGVGVDHRDAACGKQIADSTLR